MLEKEIIKEKLSKMDKDELVEYATNLAYNNELYLETLRDLKNKKYKATSEKSDNMQLSLLMKLKIL